MDLDLPTNMEKTWFWGRRRTSEPTAEATGREARGRHKRPHRERIRSTRSPNPATSAQWDDLNAYTRKAATPLNHGDGAGGDGTNTYSGLGLHSVRAPSILLVLVSHILLGDENK